MAEPATLTELELESGSGIVSALELRPERARSLLVLGHGAGAGMEHPFMDALATELASVGIATFRFQFPYMQRRSRRPDSTAVLVATARAAIRAAVSRARGLPLLAGGKSMGGRIVSHVAAVDPPPELRGLVFFGFPLHPAGRPSTARAEHLEAVALPMLFLQGSRDALAELALLTPICTRLADRARLHVLRGADHGFHVLRSSGSSDAAVLAELARVTAEWSSAHGLDRDASDVPCG